MTVARMIEILSQYQPYDQIGLVCEMWVKEDREKVRFEVGDVVSANTGPRCLIKIDRTWEEFDGGYLGYLEKGEAARL